MSIGKQKAHPAAVAYAKRQRRNQLASIRKTVAPILVFALIAGGYVFYHNKHTANVGASVAPNVACSAGTAGCGSMDEPYAGSPAADWADGPAGIVLPAAVATGDFSAGAVSADLTLAKQIAVDQTLVPDVIVSGAPPTAMMSLIDPSSSITSRLVSSIASATSANDPSNTFVRFDPKIAALITTPKVSGTVTYSQVQAGVLQVDVDLKIAYALKMPDGSAWTRTVATVGDELQFITSDSHYRVTPPGTAWPYSVGVTDYAGVECQPAAGFQEPQYPTLGGSGQGITGAPVDPYATTTAAPNPAPSATPGGCRPLSRI